MGYKVDNAIIMAAGMSSRFAPISYEMPKALIEVKGEVLIERQIKQLQKSGIGQIILVVGYRKELFYYLQEKYGVIIVENKDYRVKNNHSSIYAAKDYLKNSYVCSADNYFTGNPFEKEVDESYYAAMFSEGKTNEWCLETDADGYITEINIGGTHQWYMIGHTFWSEDFSRRFVRILEEAYYDVCTTDKLWENIFMEHLDTLKMKIRKYETGKIYEFDSLDELRLYDDRYINHSGSAIMQGIAEKLYCEEREIIAIQPIKDDNKESIGISFLCKGKQYEFYYLNGELRRIENG